MRKYRHIGLPPHSSRAVAWRILRTFIGQFSYKRETTTGGASSGAYTYLLLIPQTEAREASSCRRLPLTQLKKLCNQHRHLSRTQYSPPTLPFVSDSHRLLQHLQLPPHRSSKLEAMDVAFQVNEDIIDCFLFYTCFTSLPNHTLGSMFVSPVTI